MQITIPDSLADKVSITLPLKEFQELLNPTTPPIPPVVTPPTPPVNDGSLQITKTSIKNANICSIVKDNAPSTKQDTMTREVLKIARTVGCNMWTGFLNEQEVEKHLRSADPVNNLIEYGEIYGMVFGADTVDAMYVVISKSVKTTEEFDTRFDAYIKNLKTLGAKVFIVNDADGKNADGSLRYPPEMLKEMVRKIKRQAGNTPVMASLTAAADPVKYKKEYGFDLVEAQTFGTIPELDKFLSLGFDIYCLDAQKSATVKYLQAARLLLVKRKPLNVRWYAGFDYDGTDWRNMDEQVKEITETSKQLRG